MALVLLLSLLLNEASAHSLGESFRPDKIEVEGTVVGGVAIFNLEPSCFVSEELNVTTKDLKLYTDHNEFIHEIAASVGLTAKEIGGKGTVSTKYMRKTSTETSGMLLQIEYLRTSSSITDSCLEEAAIQPSLISELGALPYPVPKPHVRASWRKYDAFIHRWGSHLLKRTDAGAKATYHVSRSKTSVTDKIELVFKLCGKMPQLHLDACVDTGPKKSTTQSHEDEKHDVFITGGEAETQALLREGNFTIELLNRLSREATVRPSPIKHSWTSLPELLNSRVLSGVHGDDIGLEQRSTALLAYYKGYHVFGCEYQVVERKEMTKFVQTGSEEFPDYKCLQVKIGCQSNSDCEHWPLRVLGACYCTGVTCMGIKTPGVDTVQLPELERRLTLQGSHHDVSNRRCYWRTGACLCDTRGEVLEERWPLGSILLKTKTPQRRGWNWWLVVFVVLLGTLFLACVAVVLGGRKFKIA